MRDVLLDEEDRDPLVAADPVHDAEDVEDDARGEGRARLVEHDELRPRHEPPTDDEHLDLPSAQGGSELAAALAEDREVVEHLAHVGGDPGPVTPRVGADLEVLLDGHRGVHVLSLGDLGEAPLHDLVRPPVVDGLALELDGAVPDRKEPGDGLQQRRLAGTVPPEEGHDLPLGHRHVDPAQDLHLAVSGRDTLNRKQLRVSNSRHISRSRDPGRFPATRPPDHTGRSARGAQFISQPPGPSVARPESLRWFEPDPHRLQVSLHRWRLVTRRRRFGRPF